MFSFKFLGKTRIPHHKNTTEIAPVKIAPPKEVLIPVSQHIGAPATPVVSVGDEVKVGQIIAEASGFVSSPIHASVSGKVIKLEKYRSYDGRNIDAIRIESDSLMTKLETLVPPQITDVDSLVDAVAKSGIVGLGGAGFPTAVKLAALKKGNIHTVLINGAECEPYITSDARTMLDKSDLIFEAIKIFKAVAPSVTKYIFGIEMNKPACIEEISRIFRDDPTVSVTPLPTLYPQGAEKVLMRNTTGLTVPEGKLPADVGVIVINVTTLATIAEYAKTGMPLVEKCITIDGSAVKEPKNLICPIGTSIQDVIDFAGGLKEKAGKIIYGGPMTGRTACSTEEPIFKNTNAITILSPADSLSREATACIHCGRCVDACPHLLVPTAFCKAVEIENVDERAAKLEEYCINLCIECGCCSYVCPANRPLVQTNHIAKNLLKEYKSHKATLK